ncbi:MAG TPA: sensor domain-containing diguanylate cyclase [Candidatus Manganitrophaceae bacterium]|nr:sensor domain-containing diguanylate cyclase [Candidatus Manganitrophaceae bacterium]
MDRSNELLQKEDWEALLKIAKSFFSVYRFNEALYQVVRGISERIDVFRSSIVFVDDKKEIGYVVATHEAPEAKRIPLDLKKYPEIVHAGRMGESFFIPDARDHAMLAPFQEILRTVSVHSILISPLIRQEKILGDLFLRVSSKRLLTPHELQFSEWVSRLGAQAIRNAHHYESLLQEKNDLEKLAMIDFLTETHNHRSFNARLEEEFSRAIRYHLSLSCILLDIDDFKWINDTLGHRRGDRALREVASVIKGAIRKTDFLARYGGEEFVILLPQTDLAGAFQEGERIREAVRKHYYTDFDSTKKITISLGVATLPEKAIQTPDDLIRAADTALYLAKKKGKDRTEQFASSFLS